MGKIKKQGVSGQAKNFITRTQAVRKLQVTLPDFRRLCILKGIYPREPRNKRKASKTSTPSTTFYYTKDIQYLLHEPLLPLFRQQKSLSKKIGRLLGRGEVADAARLERTQTPRLKLDHIIKERYPTFTDALRDLDDALSLLFLFANLPSSPTVPAKVIASCQRLCHEFEHYLIVSHTLRKSFISIKGIYYQATIQGQDILWLVPHKFVQLVTGDVDFRIMGTFVEFYRTLVGFVNFRLYSTLGLVYPPRFEEGKDEEGAELAALRVEAKGVEGLEQRQLENGQATSTTKESVKASEAAQKAADALASSNSNIEAEDITTNDAPDTEPQTTTIDTFQPPTDPTADTLPQPASSQKNATLFRQHTFYLSRETPRHPLELLLKAFGCTRVAWDACLGAGAFTHDEQDPRITHQVVDRPPVIVEAEAEDGRGEIQVSANRAGLRVPGRTYVQPQWVWDSANNGRLMRPDLYAPGATLPPHLSPFVKPREGAYDPTKSLAELEAGNAAIENGDEASAGSEEDDGMDVDVDGAEEDASDEEDNSDNPEGSIVEDVQSIKDLADLKAGISLNGQSQTNESLSASGDSDSDAQLDGDFSALTSTNPPTKSKTKPKPTTTTSSSNPNPTADADFSGFSSEDEESTHKRSLLAEATGTPTQLNPPKGEPKDRSQAKAKAREAAAEETLQSQLMMMPRRKRKLYERMRHGNRARGEADEKLVAKRRRIEGEVGRKV
ncbi:MAG: mRNA-binding ribosome synthesis protein nop7 [Chrysothrix sp. TS-e1954]|nr:MAG: mRNA-binding ribosome synthesis protein nop7 [Chrysothrix sp. TS-e1954]